MDHLLLHSSEPPLNEWSEINVSVNPVSSRLLDGFRFLKRQLNLGLIWRACKKIWSYPFLKTKQKNNTSLYIFHFTISCCYILSVVLMLLLLILLYAVLNGVVGHGSSSEKERHAENWIEIRVNQSQRSELIQQEIIMTIIIIIHGWKGNTAVHWGSRILWGVYVSVSV